MIDGRITHTQAALVEAMASARGARLLKHTSAADEQVRGRGEVLGSTHRMEGALIPGYTVTALERRGWIYCIHEERERRIYTLTEAGRTAASEITNRTTLIA